MSIVFSRAWEDDRLDAELLGVGPGDRALVVAAAGDTALALVAQGAHVTAVDVNPDQLALVALKIAAVRALSPEERYAWFEVGRPPNAASVYRSRLRPLLDPRSAALWDRDIGRFERGLHRSTGVSRSFLRLGWIVRHATPGMVDVIERAPDSRAQHEWWRRRARRVWFSPLSHLVAARTPALTRIARNEHELARMRSGRWTRGLVERIDAVVARELVRDHPWWRPAFSGRPVAMCAATRWLQPELADAVSRASPPELVCADLRAALARFDHELAAISVSNVPDWLDAASVAELATCAAGALGPGGRLLVRRVVRPADDSFAAAGLVRDPLSDGLPERDRTALYESIDLYRLPTDELPQDGDRVPQHAAQVE